MLRTITNFVVVLFLVEKMNELWHNKRQSYILKEEKLCSIIMN